MKSLLFVFYALAVILGAPALATASLIVFTNDTIVHSFDTNYDGADILVSNCTLTVDGPHGFSSLQISDGATLTHSTSGDSTISVQRTTQDEPQVLTATNPVSLLVTGALVSITVVDTNHTTTYSNASDYVVSQTNGVVRLGRTPGSTIADGETVLVSYTVTVSTLAGLRLVVTGDVIVARAGSINAEGLGYAGGSGTGAGYGPYPFQGSYLPATGAGHGGFGGAKLPNIFNGGFTYDLTAHPLFIGSGGGSQMVSNVIGGAGGGYISLNANGTLRVEGVISANGSNGSGSGGGGGAGGGVFLSVGALLGSGTISANGGDGAAGPIDGGGGGGGGGRIGIVFNTNSYSGSITAYGGGPTNRGGAGTILLSSNSLATAQLILDNGGHAGGNSTFTEPAVDVVVTGGAAAQIPYVSIHNLLVESNGMVVPGFFPPPYNSYSDLHVSGNATIRAGGAISADGDGYSYLHPGPGYGFGPYEGPSFVRGGGGHGGSGGANPLSYGSAYDSIVQPSQGGSEGGSYGVSGATPGGAGGGALRLTVAGSLVIDGQLSANGLDGALNAGGGAGGSLWIAAAEIAGAGTISANGGAGISAAGGGGGGRIALTCSSNRFTGQIAAFGGGGIGGGGAGTIYVENNTVGARLLLIDNGALAGTNTPLYPGSFVPSSPFDLTISRGAALQPFVPLPLLSNVVVSKGGSLILPSGPTNLTLLVLKDFNIEPEALVSATGSGFAEGQGPGAGNSINGYGSGGGYGGTGGASASGAAGGGTYGSGTGPAERGSGGGAGHRGGSEGGGAIRLGVGGTLTIDGMLSADGNAGIQTNSGGGSGGSIWVTANKVTGSGWLSASGGSGGPSGGGGGGGGGRIAIYSHANSYRGVALEAGGPGTNYGHPGSLFESELVPFQVTSQVPVGVVSNFVALVDFHFSDFVDTVDISSSGFSLFTPSGPVAASNVTVSATGPSSVRFAFPVQDKVGDYRFVLSSGITSLVGQTLSEVYTGSFSIRLPLISGTVTDTNGQPVAGVLLQSLGLLHPGSTDTNGDYSIGVPPGWFGRITPVFGASMFIPSGITYTNVSVSHANQNYVLVPTIAPQLSASLSADKLEVAWHGLAGVTYDAAWSTNLIHWQPFYTVYGSNGGLHLSYPLSNGPVGFIRVRASD